MTISFQSQTQKTQKPYSKQFLSSFRIEEKDLIFVVGGIGMAIYLGITDLALLVTILCSFAIAGSLYFISACLPLVSKKLNFRISIWHLLTVVCGLTLAFSSFEPSHALFLTGLEDEIVDLVTSTTNGVSSISEAQVETLFTFVRIALILVALGGGFAAWQQQQQGQSMTPIIMFVGGLFGIVLAIDIMTAVIATGT